MYTYTDNQININIYIIYYILYIYILYIIYIHIYVCMYVCTYVRTYVCMEIYNIVFLRIHIAFGIEPIAHGYLLRYTWE